VWGSSPRPTIGPDWERAPPPTARSVRLVADGGRTGCGALIQSGQAGTRLIVTANGRPSLSPLNEHRHDDVDVVLATDGAEDAGVGGAGGFEGELAAAEHLQDIL